MSRLDVHRMRTGEQDYVLDVQASLLSHLVTRVVVPLIPAESTSKPIGELNPVFDIDGTLHVMLTQSLASVYVRELGPVKLSLDAQHDMVTRALDILLLGF